MSTNKERIDLQINSTNKERIDLQINFNQMEGVGDKLRQIEAIISQMFNILITRHEC